MAERIWIGGTSGSETNWSVSTNWIENFIPTSADSALFNISGNGYDCLLTETSICKYLIFTSGYTKTFSTNNQLFESSILVPDPPENIVVTTISTSVLLLTWDFDSYVKGFDIYRSESLTGTFTKINTYAIQDLSFYDGQQTVALSADTVYYYKMKALGPTSEYDSTFSAIVSGTTAKDNANNQTYYYPETIRNVTVAVLDMFDDFYIKRYDKTPAKKGTVVKTVHVPIMFGPQEKRHMDELRGTKDGWQAPPVPRLSLVLNGIEYDPSRASGINEIRHFYDTSLQLKDLDGFFADVNPAPYNFNFTLSVITDSLSDFSQIVENILPYFNPNRYLRVKEFSFLNIERDLPLALGGITPNFTDSLEVGQERRVDGDMSLTVQGWMYRPISSEKIIKTINTSFLIVDFANE